MTAISPSKLGSVAIGRNEGDRLHKCLLSVTNSVASLVYVDSGSTDDSVAFAKSIGVEVVQLDMSIPFTAARARNEGFNRLLELSPSIDFVQFIDGDCEIVRGWVDKAVETLRQHEDVAVVCGRRRERFPEASIYNRFCDIEWNTPIGEADACGGDALMRVSPFKELGGYNASLIAGEEPELCVRFRLAGWRILRIDADMTLHDADMHYFSQWWKRTVRTGHAYAQGYALHGHTSLRHYLRPVRSIFIWGMAAPSLIIFSLLATWWVPWVKYLALLGIVGYSRIVQRSYADSRNRGAGAGDALLYGLSIAAAKIPQLLGAIKYYTNRRKGKQTSLIEYKTPDAAKTRT